MQETFVLQFVLGLPKNLLVCLDYYGNCIMTPYTVAQLAQKEDRMQRKCEKLNYYRTIRYYRIGVKHAFAELKQYKKILSVWRHPRPLLSQLHVVTICAGVVCPKKLDG